MGGVIRTGLKQQHADETDRTEKAAAAGYIKSDLSHSGGQYR